MPSHLSKRECATLEKILKERLSGKLPDIFHNSLITSCNLKRFRNFPPADSTWRQYSPYYPQFLK